jgi:nitroimidazol reductase NimA-like FMN-containing flavoprotein (pyridoxamine 5'-phosphate oxidase superfamily)
MSDTAPTPRTSLRRHPERGHHDRFTIDAILDEAPFCHLGFVVDGQPFVVPTIHARAGDALFIHGSTASRMIRALSGGVPICVTATILDGLVLARSVFNHSMNYRSVMVLGRAREVIGRDQKVAAMEAVVEHVLRGRWQEARHPTAKELRATSILELPLAEASAKVRTGPPKDDDEDLALPVWAGEVPIRLARLAPRPDPRLATDLLPPRSLAQVDRFDAHA